MYSLGSVCFTLELNLLIPPLLLFPIHRKKKKEGVFETQPFSLWEMFSMDFLF